jgi:hypothetical protein
MRIRSLARPETALSALALVLAALTSAPSASAWPFFVTDWQSLYPTSTTDDAVIATQGQACAVCHFAPFGGEGWNPYGWEIRRIFQQTNDIQASILAAAAFDSEPNPFTFANALEIANGTQPGWTPGAVNLRYADDGITTGQTPPAISGSFDPAASPMVPLCRPGEAGVADCPCANPVVLQNRGCDNSETTGGAALTASGDASLAGDTLTFSTAGERATSLSIVLQGNTLASGGLVFGQGVRCATGQLLRLYSKNAVAGSITAPVGAEPSVSTRAAALGDVIAPGDTRWYLVYYRDPVVLGGCPGGSTFNATQTGRVDWQP